MHNGDGDQLSNSDVILISSDRNKATYHIDTASLHEQFNVRASSFYIIPTASPTSSPTLSPTANPTAPVGYLGDACTHCVDGMCYRPLENMDWTKSGSSLRCNREYKSLPPGWELADYRCDILQANRWSSHLMCFSDSKCYRTANFLPACNYYGSWLLQSGTQYKSRGCWAGILIQRPAAGFEGGGCNEPYPPPPCHNVGDRVRIVPGSRHDGQASGHCATVSTETCEFGDYQRFWFDNGYNNLYEYNDIELWDECAPAPTQAPTTAPTATLELYEIILPATTTTELVHGACVVGATSVIASSTHPSLTYTTEPFAAADSFQAWDDRNYQIVVTEETPCSGGTFLKPSLHKAIPLGTSISIDSYFHEAPPTVCVFVEEGLERDGGLSQSLTAPEVSHGFVDHGVVQGFTWPWDLPIRMLCKTPEFSSTLDPAALDTCGRSCIPRWFLVNVINMYDPAKGYLDTYGHANRGGFGVETAQTPTRDSGSGTWRIIFGANELHFGSTVVLINERDPKTGYLGHDWPSMRSVFESVEVSSGPGLGKCLGHDGWGGLYLYSCTGATNQAFKLEGGKLVVEGGNFANQCVKADGWFWPKLRPCDYTDMQQKWHLSSGKFVTYQDSTARCLRYDPSWSATRLKVEECTDDAMDQIWRHPLQTWAGNNAIPVGVSFSTFVAQHTCSLLNSVLPFSQFIPP